VEVWNVRDCATLEDAFKGVTKIQGRLDLTFWDTRKVESMSSAFQNTSFDVDVSTWDVSAVTTMSFMFSRATGFNGDVSEWDVSKVSFMGMMFRGASTFNGDVRRWDVARVHDMDSMFEGAESFECDLGRWDVSKVKKMQKMFRNATSFKGKGVEKWKPAEGVEVTDMFADAHQYRSLRSSGRVTCKCQRTGVRLRAYGAVLCKTRRAAPRRDRGTIFYTYERGEPNIANPSIYSLLIQNIELQSSSDKVQFMTTFLLFSLESLFAFTNIAPIFALLMARGALMAHSETSWSKEAAEWNMAAMFCILLRVHPEMSWLNAFASLNISTALFTFLTSYLLMSPLKLVAPLNM
jgi:hypothetical protein